MFSYIDEGIRARLEEAGKLRVVHDPSGRVLSLLGPIPMPVEEPGTGKERILEWYAFVRRTELEGVDRIASGIRSGTSRDLVGLVSSFMCVNSLLVHGDLAADPSPLVRVHSCCMTGDVFGSKRCECGPQFELAMDRILAEKAGAMIYMASHEGRGIGLWAKGVTYILQDMGQDTYQANESLGLPADSRDFGDAAVVLREFIAPGASVRLLTNNPMKVEHLRRGGVAIGEVVPLVAGLSRYNLRYLRAKMSKGHAFGDALPPEGRGEGD